MSCDDLCSSETQCTCRKAFDHCKWTAPTPDGLLGHNHWPFGTMGFLMTRKSSRHMWRTEIGKGTVETAHPLGCAWALLHLRCDVTPLEVWYTPKTCMFPARLPKGVLFPDLYQSFNEVCISFFYFLVLEIKRCGGMHTVPVKKWKFGDEYCGKAKVLFKGCAVFEGVFCSRVAYMEIMETIGLFPQQLLPPVYFKHTVTWC